MSSNSNLKNSRKIIITAAVLVALAFFASFLASSYFAGPVVNDNAIKNGNLSVGPGNSSVHIYKAKGMANTNHAHAALMVFVNDKLLDFSTPKYQNRSLQMHFEKGDGFTIHKHDRTEWLGPFFESLNMSFSKYCLIVIDRSRYCENFDNQVAFFVNGISNNLFQHYTPDNGDRILISYGNNRMDEIANQLARLKALRITP